MILTVTPNLALDRTYEVPRLEPGEVHSVGRYVARGGGKGVNVASTAHVMGHAVLVTGFAGGLAAAEVESDLDRRGVPHRFTPITGQTRQSVAVVDMSAGGAVTVFNETGPHTDAADWARLAADVSAAAAGGAQGAEILVVSGSLPPYSPDTGVADLLRAVPGVPAVLDVRGPALLAALSMRPALVKPNLAELRETLGAHHDAVSGARELQARGATLVVVSDGARGVTLVPLDGPVVTARLPESLRGNPTGAGDAMAAGLATALIDGLDHRTMLAQAVAWGAAAVLQPVAGIIHRDDVARLLPAVVDQEI